ncbi:MAG: Abortive infection protein [Thermoleophilia bacterium]|nr:Abortive infection protein [Thermoleophilia bacterium]
MAGLGPRGTKTHVAALHGGDDSGMTAQSSAHPHALRHAWHAPAGALLPAAGTLEVPRPHTGLRSWCDVAGGIAFAMFIAICCMRVGTALFAGAGWMPVIAWESVWLMAAIACSRLLPNGIRHDISWRSTLHGLALDWPELAYAASTLVFMSMQIGGFRLAAGPVGLALAVGTAEEFIFRVLMLGWLVTRLPAPQALAVSSVVFGLAHLHELSPIGLVSVLPQTAGGFVLGAIYLRTRNPLGGILAHAFWDYPYFMALGVVSGGSTAGGMPPLVQLAPWLGFLVYGLWLVRDGIPLVGRISPVGEDGQERVARGAPLRV